MNIATNSDDFLRIKFSRVGTYHLENQVKKMNILDLSVPLPHDNLRDQPYAPVCFSWGASRQNRGIFAKLKNFWSCSRFLRFSHLKSQCVENLKFSHFKSAMF
jgi:hypothetical protein